MTYKDKNKNMKIQKVININFHITAECQWLPTLYNEATILQVSDENPNVTFRKGDQVHIKCPDNMIPDGPVNSTCGEYGFFIPGSFKCKLSSKLLDGC